MPVKHAKGPKIWLTFASKKICRSGSMVNLKKKINKFQCFLSLNLKKNKSVKFNKFCFFFKSEPKKIGKTLNLKNNKKFLKIVLDPNSNLSLCLQTSILFLFQLMTECWHPMPSARLTALKSQISLSWMKFDGKNPMFYFIPWLPNQVVKKLCVFVQS